jgi:hypothetical protein
MTQRIDIPVCLFWATLFTLETGLAVLTVWWLS